MDSFAVRTLEFADPGGPFVGLAVDRDPPPCWPWNEVAPEQVVVRVLQAARMRTVEGAFAELTGALKLPRPAVPSWGWLYHQLTALRDVTDAGYLVLITDASQLLADADHRDARSLGRTLLLAAAEWASQDNVPGHPASVLRTIFQVRTVDEASWLTSHLAIGVHAVA